MPDVTDFNQNYNFEICEYIRRGKLDKIKKIVNEVGFSHCQTWQNGYMLLYYALEYNRLDVAKWFLSKSCQVNPDNKKFLQKTALHLAVCLNKSDVVRILLKRGASVTANNEYRETALHACFKRRRSKNVNNELLTIIKLLLKHGAQVNAKGGMFKDTPLSYVLKHKFHCLRIVKLLLSSGAHINEYDLYGKTPLHIAVENKDKKIIKFLLERGANVNFKNRNGRSPLHVAVRNNSADIVKVLLAYKADVNDVIFGFEECRWTALHIAVKNKDKKITALLLKHRANVNAKDDRNRTPLHIASMGRNLDLLKMLIAAGADVNEPDIQGQIPLHLAIRIEDESMVEFLLRHKADIKAKRNDGKSSIHFASENRSDGIAKIIIARGANIADMTFDGRSGLHFAAKKGSRELVELFLKMGINIDVKSKVDGLTPLYYAVKKRHCHVAEYLLFCGADIGLKIRIYQTLLRLAVYDMNKEMVELLLSWNADVNAEDSDDETPLFIAADTHRYKDIPGSEMMQDITNLLIMHITKLRVLNAHVSEQNLNLIRDNQKLSTYYECCKNELESMRVRRVCDNVTYFDMLTKSTDAIVSYTRNNQLEAVIESCEHSKLFPIYFSVMDKKYKRAKMKRDLLDVGEGALRFLLSSGSQKLAVEMPYFVVREILSYFSITDLKILASVCQNSSSQKNSNSRS